jgi:hypothetical protein
MHIDIGGVELALKVSFPKTQVQVSDICFMLRFEDTEIEFVRPERILSL